MNGSHLSCLMGYGYVYQKFIIFIYFFDRGMIVTLGIPLSAVDLTCCRNTLLMHSPQILSDGSAMLDMNHPLAGKERGASWWFHGKDGSVHLHTYRSKGKMMNRYE